MSVVGLSASNPDIRRGILRIWIFCELTRQSLPMRPLRGGQLAPHHGVQVWAGLLHCTEYSKTLYAVQQLKGSAGARWALYTTALPADHHVPWGEFRTTFHTHHLSAGLLHTKLKESLDLKHGNHSVFDYMRQFNTLAQYGSYHIDTNEKKTNLYGAGLTIHLQEHLRQFASYRTMSW
jgi:hypothetical protein